MSPRIRALLVLTATMGAIVGPLGTWMEANMGRHMLIQFPLILTAGGLLGPALPAAGRQRVADLNAHGLPGLLLFLVVTAFWMVPRALDLSLLSSEIEFAKVTSLLGAGAAIQLSWRAAGPVVQVFFLGNWAWMSAAVGLSYQNNPEQLCNFYLADQQVVAGQGLVVLPLILTLAWIVSLIQSGYLWDLRPDKPGGRYGEN